MNRYSMFITLGCVMMACGTVNAANLLTSGDGEGAAFAQIVIMLCNGDRDNAPVLLFDDARLEEIETDGKQPGKEMLNHHKDHP